MKSFKFDYNNYRVQYNDGEVEIEEHDQWGTYVGSVTLPMPALLEIHAKVDELYPFHNPSCNEVSAARGALERARDVRNVAKPDAVFEEALKAYMDITSRHKEAFGCQ